MVTLDPTGIGGGILRGAVGLNVKGGSGTEDLGPVEESEVA